MREAPTQAENATATEFISRREYRRSRTFFDEVESAPLVSELDDSPHIPESMDDSSRRSTLGRWSSVGVVGAASMVAAGCDPVRGALGGSATQVGSAASSSIASSRRPTRPSAGSSKPSATPAPSMSSMTDAPSAASRSSRSSGRHAGSWVSEEAQVIAESKQAQPGVPTSRSARRKAEKSAPHRASGAPTTSPTASPAANGAQRPSAPKRSAHRGQGEPVANKAPIDASNPNAKAPAPKANSSAPQPSRPTSARPARTSGTNVYTEPPQAATITKEAALAPGLTLRTTPEWHLARRAAQAPSAQLAAEIRAAGKVKWLDQQLNPGSIDDSFCENLIRYNFRWAISTVAAVRSEAGDKDFRAAPEVRNAIYYRARTTKRVLLESVVELLGDHIYVPINGKLEPVSGEYDQLLRRHAFGKYSDLLIAALTHPALLVELDNQLSHRASPNENLGRELLELYTVGRDAYTEDDVAGSTRILTGHGINWATRGYAYSPADHATGPVRVLGFSDANSSAAAGPQLLRRYATYLASHPATARRLARKFAVRFISDNPSPATVEQLAKAYLANGTSLAALTRATFMHPDFDASIGLKWRRPLEFVMTIARASGVTQIAPPGRHDAGETYNEGKFGWLVRKAGHAPRAWPAVDGYPDTAAHWTSSNVMLSLWNAAQDAVMGDEKESGRTPWVKVLGIKPGDDADATARRITTHLTGYTWNDEHVKNVAALLTDGFEKPYAPGRKVAPKYLDDLTLHAVRLIFASPYGFLR